MHLLKPLLALSLLAGSSLAHANLQLAQKNTCMSCHAVDKKVLGPAYQEVAKKYASHIAGRLAKRLHRDDVAIRLGAALRRAVRA